MIIAYLNSSEAKESKFLKGKYDGKELRGHMKYNNILFQISHLGSQI